MLFQLLRLRKNIREARENPGKFAGSQAAGLATSIVIIPLLIAVLWLALLFLFGFTHVLGGPFGFFRFLFVFTLIIMVPIIVFLAKTIRVIRSSVRGTVNKVTEIQQRPARDATFTEEK
ncbi:MAG TPA: hypothetical protein VG982_01540 [Candidatus Paceibacterota bacterium]|jgi:uncharacterized membrane protein|nr:hypothetical protein [Candidatus Paceibacterota bacterium]